MKYLYLLLAIVLIFAQPSNAAFRYVKQEGQALSHQRIANALPAQHVKHNLLRFLRPNPDDSYLSASEGLVSFAASIFSLAFFVAASLTSFPLFIIPAFMFAVVAVVFGAIGIKRRKRGFALIGLALGLIEIVAGFFILAML